MDRPPNVTRSLRKGYYASVTYTDHLVGMLLDKLAALGHEDDTVVGLIGDHGWQVNPFPRLGFGAAQPVLESSFVLALYLWMDFKTSQIVGCFCAQLGEHNIWGKHTNFELGKLSPNHRRDFKPLSLDSVLTQS